MHLTLISPPCWTLEEYTDSRLKSSLTICNRIWVIVYTLLLVIRTYNLHTCVHVCAHMGVCLCVEGCAQVSRYYRYSTNCPGKSHCLSFLQILFVPFLFLYYPNWKSKSYFLMWPWSLTIVLLMINSVTRHWRYVLPSKPPPLFWLTEMLSVKAPSHSKMEKYMTHLFHPDQNGPPAQGSGLIN